MRRRRLVEQGKRLSQADHLEIQRQISRRRDLCDRGGGCRMLYEVDSTVDGSNGRFDAEAARALSAAAVSRRAREAFSGIGRRSLAAPDSSPPGQGSFDNLS